MDRKSENDFKNMRDSGGLLATAQIEYNYQDIQELLRQIDYIDRTLHERADKIMGESRPQINLYDREKRMSPESEKLRRRTIDLLKDGEQVLHSIQKFDTDNREKYSVKD